jgi:hypothetical protein
MDVEDRRKIMNRLFAVLAAGALVLASVAPSYARPAGGPQGLAGGQPAPHAASRGGFQGHRAAVPRPQPFVFGRQHLHRGFPGRAFVGVTPFVVGPAFAYGAYGWASAPFEAYEPPVVYSAPPPSYWYYCQSAGGYYPDVPACAEPWVPVPSQ